MVLDYVEKILASPNAPQQISALYDALQAEKSVGMISVNGLRLVSKRNLLTVKSSYIHPLKSGILV